MELVYVEVGESERESCVRRTIREGQGENLRARPRWGKKSADVPERGGKNQS